MENSRWYDIKDKLKNSFSLKRTRITLYIAAVLWVAVGTQIIMNRVFKEEVQITEAFVKSDTEEMQSSIEVVAEYKSSFLQEEAIKDIIYNLADAIGLVIDDDVTILEEDSRSEYYYYKQAKKAATEIKVISLEQEEDSSTNIRNYIIVRLSISDGIQSIDKYKKQLENALNEIGVQSKQITLKYEGNREGSLTTKQKQEISKLLVNELQGEIALEYDEGDLYTVYAYTGMLNEYVTTMGNKINVQIAITYNESINKTKIMLATPILNENW